MRVAKRWTLEAIMAAGNVFVQEGEGAEGQEGETGGTGKPEGGGDQNKTGGSGKDSDETDDPEVLKRRLKNKTEEQDRQFGKLKEAERERDELKAKQEEQDRKGRTELENAKNDLEARDKTIQSLHETVKRLTIDNAFMALKDIDWHNPKRALGLVDLSDIEFDAETGEVKDSSKILAAAKKLASEEPYLVKTKSSDDDAGSGQGSRRSGSIPAKGGKGGTGPTDDEIRNKYRIRR